MEKYLECLTGDLYPTGKLRHRIFKDREKNRDNYRNAPQMKLETWELELYDQDIQCGDFVSINNNTPFEIKDISLKHITHNSYETTFVGQSNKLTFECYGNVNIAFYR